VALLGALLSELAFLGVSLGLMALALRRRPAGGLFSALMPGALPALVLAGLTFYQWQQADDPGLKAAHQSMVAPLQQAAKDRFGKPEQAAERQQLMDMGEAVFAVAPALELLLRLALLAPLAALMRRRRQRAGLAPDAGPLSHWGAPWWMAWVLLGPLFWLMGKLAAWSRNPRTRLLAPLALGTAVFALLMLEDLRPLLALVILTGLFEPWLDLRRLHQPPAGEPLDKGGEA